MSLRPLLAEIRACRLCAEHLPAGPRPVLQMSSTARILIAGQAPGRRVHETGIPFDDASGVRLREWLGVGPEVFYDATRIAILPMAFCYPGKGRSGDLAPRPECAERWRASLLRELKRVRLTVLVGRYAIGYHLGREAGDQLTETVRRAAATATELFPLPHPSPRNTPWLSRHPWFETQVLPGLRRAVAKALAD